MANPTVFGDDVIDGVDSVMATHVNNLRGWASKSSPLIVNMGTVSDTDGVTTFTDTDLPFQSIDALGDTDYTVYLPAASTDNHPFYLFNASTDSQQILIKNSSSDAIDTIPSGRSSLVVSNGSRWESVSGIGVTATATPTSDSIPISDGNGYLNSWINPNAGTSFPVAPATNDRYFRTDLGLSCYYDGTRWLTENEYAFSLWPELGVTVDTTGMGLSYGVALTVTYAPYVTRIVASLYPGATNNGSNYWSLVLTGYQQNMAGGTAFATVTTAALTAEQTTAVEVAASTSLHGTDNKLFRVICDKGAGSPSDLTVDSFMIYFRKIIT